MWEKIINRLFTVKSIVTLTLTAVFAFLSATGAIAADAFQDIFYIIVAFYLVALWRKLPRQTALQLNKK